MGINSGEPKKAKGSNGDQLLVIQTMDLLVREVQVWDIVSDALSILPGYFDDENQRLFA